MTTTRLDGKRILLTQADSFIGPTLNQVFTELGATVIADTRLLDAPEAPGQLVQDTGHVDILVIHLVAPAFAEEATPAQEVTDAQWQAAFAHLSDPVPRLCRAVLPQMLERQAGKIVLIGSASALRGIKKFSTYSAARGAQLAYIQALGVEVARQGIQVNAVAQNYVDNPTYFPQALQDNPAFQKHMQREVPLGRLVSAEEDARFIAYLCSDAADCFVGQIFPVSGGWINR